MHKCNDNYEKIRKKIEEDQKKYKYCYIQGPTGPAGIQGEQGIRGEKGEPGPATIKIGKIETIDSNEMAEVLNVGTDENVILDFKIPQGIKGDKGDKGDQGETGVSEKNPASYDAILFVSYAQAHYSKVMTFQEQLDINNDGYFDLTDNTNITLNYSGIYEITLCGQISGVDQSHGAIFYLSNTNGAVIQDLSFELKAGTTSRMDCSETIITKIDAQTTLYIRCGIIGDSNTANIDFSNVNLVIKKYNASI